MLDHFCLEILWIKTFQRRSVPSIGIRLRPPVETNNIGLFSNILDAKHFHKRLPHSDILQAMKLSLSLVLHFLHTTSL